MAIIHSVDAVIVACHVIPFPTIQSTGSLYRYLVIEDDLRLDDRDVDRHCLHFSR